MAGKTEWRAIERIILAKAAHSDSIAAEALDEYNMLVRQDKRPIIEQRTIGDFIEYRVWDRALRPPPG